MRSRATASLILALAGGLLSTAAPALAADNGTIGVAITASAPCVTVSGQFNYGTLSFSTAGTTSNSAVTLGPSITNCSGTTEQYSAHTSNLANGSNVWSPTSVTGNPCPVLNTFVLNVSSVGPGGSNGNLTTSSELALGSSSTSTPYNWASLFTMPCAGSLGAGVPMSGQITITATF